VNCSEQDRLRTDAARALDAIIELSDKLLDALDSVQTESLTILKNDLESAMAAKNRAFAALVQHREEHGC
jgi:uncharacterized ferritin-like protein (DUF455 family)